MSRICLKRKEMHKKISLFSNPEHFNTENYEVESLADVSNSPISKATVQQDSNHNQRMFEEFKIQYDQLRQTYQKQRIAYDEMAQQKKRMQIQLLNSNPEFYEKEIKRLRGEVQKLQQQNEDYKHKYIIAENSKKQLEATVKVRNEELKKTIQLIEKEKVTCVQLKHQLGEKQKLFQRITGQMQKSNGVLSQSYEQTNNRAQKLQIALKTKSQDFEALQRNYDHLAKKLSQTEKAMKSNKEIFDQTNSKKTQIVDELQTKLRNLTRQSRDTIEDLENKLVQVKNQRKTENLLIDKNIEYNKNLKQQRLLQLEVVRLEEINKQLKLDFDDKCKLVKALQQKLITTYSQEEYKELQKRLQNTEQNISDIRKECEQKINQYEKQIENIKLSQFRNPAIEEGVKNDFQTLLKVQLQENSKIKKELSVKIDEIYNLKADKDELKCKIKVLQDEISILNKKIKAQEKNHKIQTDVTSQNLKNQIDSLKRKLDMMQGKVDQKNKEVKQKENFIMNTIIGRSRQEDVPLIMAQMQRIFQADYNTKLAAALQKIQQLQHKQ